MKDIKIYTDKEEPLEDALKTLTNTWIESGEYCDNTVITLRDAVIELKKELETLNESISENIPIGEYQWGFKKYDPIYITDENNSK